MKSYKLGIIEILSEDLDINRSTWTHKELTFYEAEELIEKLGDGWRLPTMKEIIFLQEYSDLNILNLKGAYWVSGGLPEDELVLDTEWNYAYYFQIKRRGGVPKSERYRVRLVRSI